jgi:hypothetical protein
LQFYHSFFSYFMYVMILNFNMFCTSMKHVILKKSYALWLWSQLNIVGANSICPISYRSCFIHIASFVALVVALYFTSIEDKAIVGWRLLLQLISPTSK